MKIKYSILFLLLSLVSVYSQEIQEKEGHIISKKGDTLVLYFVMGKKSVHPLSFKTQNDLKDAERLYKEKTTQEAPLLKVVLSYEEVPANQPSILGTPLQVHSIKAIE